MWDATSYKGRSCKKGSGQGDGVSVAPKNGYKVTPPVMLAGV